MQLKKLMGPLTVTSEDPLVLIKLKMNSGLKYAEARGNEETIYRNNCIFMLFLLEKHMHNGKVSV